MTSWATSLQAKLIIGFVLVLVLSLGGLILFASYLADREGERFEREVSRARNIRVLSEAQNTDSAGPGAPGRPGGDSFEGSNLSWYLIVLGADNHVVSTSQSYELPVVGENELAWIVPLYVDGEQVNRLMVRPLAANSTLEAPSPQLVSAFRNSLMWTGIVASVLGIGVIYILTRRILVPVQQLTSAAQLVGKGQAVPEIPSNGKDEIGRLTLTFNLMTRELQAAEKERQRMLADVAHELRTPLTNAQGYVEAIRDGLKKPDAASIEAVYRQITQLHRLIDDLRLLSIAESGHLDLRLESQPIAELLDSVIDDFELRAQAKGIVLRRDYRPDLSTMIIDRARIAQVVTNLLENALLHTPPGGSIAVEAQKAGDRVLVKVIDTGDGIPEEAIPHVFDRLYRHDRSRNRASGGSGLGLSIVKHLVEAHGGAIRADNDVSGGACFTFSLPIRFNPRVRNRTVASLK